ncbi:MAG: T9SS type A sorting domain-containing protein [Saprospiraceae bacterium]|nr:T9SS type A sorting domain-containing protein [Saprospiraceae bacterium]MBP6445419.1 T9SS type A sorting domain-containing protein [Saprospiraceae bacterium]
MTKLYTFLFLICFSSVYSQKTFLRENFNYPAGALLNANGWYAHNAGTTNPIAVSGEGLSWSKSSYVGSGKGRAAAVVNTGSDENRPFDSWADTMSVYASFLVKADTVIVNSGPYFFHFVQYSSPAVPVFTATNSSFRGRVYVSPGSAANKMKIGITFGTSTDVAADGGQSEDLNIGETYLVVAKYSFVTGADNDQISLYLFKDGDKIDTEPTKATLGPYGKGGGTSANPDISSIQGVALRQFAASQKITVDGIYVRNHWNMTTEGTSSASDIVRSSLNIFPNPTSDRLINISNPENAPVKVCVYDIAGRIVLDQRVENNQIDLSHCLNGMYIVQLTQSNETVSKKLVLH